MVHVSFCVARVLFYPLNFGVAYLRGLQTGDPSLLRPYGLDYTVIMQGSPVYIPQLLVYCEKLCLWCSAHYIEYAAFLHTYIFPHGNCGSFPSMKVSMADHAAESSGLEALWAVANIHCFCKLDKSCCLIAGSSYTSRYPTYLHSIAHSTVVSPSPSLGPEPLTLSYINAVAEW